MTKSFSIFIILFLVALSFLFLRDFKTQQNPFQTIEAPPAFQATSNASLHTNFEKWREFQSVRKTFKVLLPALPQHVADKIPDPATGEIRKYETFIAAGDNGAAFMINAITVPKKLEFNASDDAMKAAVTDIISRNKENKLHDLKSSKFHDYPAYDFFITSNDMTIAGKVFTQGNIIYVLSMIAQTALYNPGELEYFINSFQLLDTKTK